MSSDLGGEEHGGDVIGDVGGLDGLRGHADGGRKRLNVLDDDAAGANDALASEGDLGDDRGADADEGAGFDLDAAGDAHAGADVGALADHGLVVDDASGIEDDRVADLAMCANDYSGSDYDVTPEGSVVCEGSRGVDRIDQVQAIALDLSGEPPAHAVVADRDDDAGDVEFLGEAWKVVDKTAYGNSVDATAVDVGVIVEKGDDLVAAVLKKDVEDDAAVSPGAEDDDPLAGLLRFETSHVSHLLADWGGGPQPPARHPFIGLYRHVGTSTEPKRAGTGVQGALFRRVAGSRRNKPQEDGK